MMPNDPNFKTKNCNIGVEPCPRILMSHPSGGEDEGQARSAQKNGSKVTELKQNSLRWSPHTKRTI
jgi:hypothetical protein